MPHGRIAHRPLHRLRPAAARPAAAAARPADALAPGVAVVGVLLGRPRHRRAGGGCDQPRASAAAWPARPNRIRAATTAATSAAPSPSAALIHTGGSVAIRGGLRGRPRGPPRGDCEDPGRLLRGRSAPAAATAGGGHPGGRHARSGQRGQRQAPGRVRQSTDDGTDVAELVLQRPGQPAVEAKPTGPPGAAGGGVQRQARAGRRRRHGGRAASNRPWNAASSSGRRFYWSARAPGPPAGRDLEGSGGVAAAAAAASRAPAAAIDSAPATYQARS